MAKTVGHNGININARGRDIFFLEGQHERCNFAVSM